MLVGVLAPTLFASGQTYMEQVPTREGMDIYAMHATFQACPEGKVHRLREYGLWKVRTPTGGHMLARGGDAHASMGAVL